MTFKIRFQPLAVEDLDSAYQYAAQHAPQTAIRWLDRFQKAIQTLDHNPERCELAIEDRKSSHTLRQYLFGKRPNIFRVIYTIDDVEKTVWILRILRAQRLPLDRDELFESESPS